MSLPEPGDLDWGPAVNDAIEAAQSDAADAASNANNAVGTANYARQRVDGMGLATASQVVDAIENEPSVQTALSASYVSKWKASTAYLATDIVLAPDGKVIQRNADGTSRSTYDTTEQGRWTVVTGGTSGGFDITDNGDGTATLTATGSSTITDNGDGTATLAA